jgi:hypothetical protein
MDSDLCTPDSARLAELEGIISRGLASFGEVGQALLEIRERRLYRATHPTFEAYCRERWGWSKTHANRQIQAAELAGALTPIGVIPPNEAQARELAPLLSQGPEAVRAAWVAATATNAAPTAANVRAVVQRPVTPEEDIWAWAEATLDGPFTPEDFDGGTGWITTKLLHHLRAPAATSCLLRMADEYRVPVLHLAPADELAELLRLTYPYAKSAKTFETASVSLQDMIALKLTAQRICGLVFHELERREKAQRLNRHGRHQPSPGAVHKKLLQRIDDALARLGTGARREAP